MGDLIAAFDWSATPLGSIAKWPVSLKSSVGFIVRSKIPMVMLWGVDGVMIYNDAYSEFAGGRHPDLLGKKVLSGGWPEVAEFNANVLKVGLAGGALTYKDQELTLNRSGAPEQVFMDLDYSPVLDDEGRPAGVIAIVIETTGRVISERLRKAAEAKAHLEADRVQLALGAGAIVGTWFWDLPTDRFTIDAAFARSFGLDPALGHSGIPLEQIIATVHPDDRDALMTAINAAIAQGGAYAHQYRVRRDDGHYYWIEANGRVEHAPDGTPLRFPGVLLDITARKAADEALVELNATLEQRVQERTKALQDSKDFSRLALSAVNGVGVWTYDALTNRFTCDAAISQLYGLDPKAGAAGLTAEAFLANVHPDDRAALADTMAVGLECPGDLELEYRLLHADGSVHWVLSRGHTYFEGGKAVRRTGVGVETTEKRQLEEQLRQSQKMEAVGQLTGGIAHDFNNLLAGIAGSLELMQKRIADQGLAGLDRYLGIAQASTQRAAALTQRLLAFSRRQTLDPKPIDVNRLVAGVEDLMRRTVGPNIEIAVVAASGLWATKIDESQLENAILNLVINARDAMPDGGRITIETANTWLDGRIAKERDLPPGQYISLCVADTGTGMTADVIERAFDPFYTTKPLGQGTGLGLSMIHGFARQSGGQVRIYSEIGQGTTMCLYFPRFAGSAEPGEIEDADHGLEPGYGETVLVIDDEQPVRTLISEVLEEAGYRVLEASDGPSGLKVLQADTRIDLLITDVGLPGGFNGRQVADAARQARPDLKVLFVTGYAEKAVVGDGHLDPGMQVITKPFPMTALALRVRQIIEGS